MPKKKAETTAAAPATFEDALHRLEEIVSQLEHGEAPLETALALYEEGVGLARFCSSQVRDAERRVMLLEDKNGELAARPFAKSGDNSRSLPEEEEDEEPEDGDESEDQEDEEPEDDSDSARENQKRLF